jgi:methylglutaconyl-CoA hydratase
MQAQEILIDKQPNGIVTLILNRPERHNALNDQLISSLIDQLTLLDNDNDVKVVILAANGKNFSAGADLEWMKKMAHFTQEQNYQDALQLVTLFKLLHGMQKPTIVLAKGFTMGGGIGLLACCDIAIAEQEAKFCFSEAKLGLVPATIAPYIIKAIGSRVALYYFLTAKLFTAKEAQEIHLIHEVVAEKDLLTTGIDLAISLLKNGPKALNEIKQLVTKFNPFNEEILQETAKIIAEVRATQEAQEGLSAFFEKRPPKW